MVQVINRPILMVGHGSPSHPVSQEIAVRDLVCRLSSLTPQTHVRGATLASKGAVDRAVDDMVNPIVCPWFMTDGWFVRSNLPKRLKAAGLAQWQTTPPMGMLPGIGRLMGDHLNKKLRLLGWDAQDTTVIMAAHGSPSSAKPREATELAAGALARHGPFKAIRTCYVDEPPAIRDVAHSAGQAIVLPFFAARAGHVTDDLPTELSAAGFTGPVLDPVGVWPETPGLALAAIAELQQGVIT